METPYDRLARNVAEAYLAYDDGISFNNDATMREAYALANDIVDQYQLWGIPWSTVREWVKECRPDLWATRSGLSDPNHPAAQRERPGGATN